MIASSNYLVQYEREDLLVTASSVPGYRLGDPTLPRSPLTMDDLATLKASMSF